MQRRAVGLRSSHLELHVILNNYLRRIAKHVINFRCNKYLNLASNSNYEEELQLILIIFRHQQCRYEAGIWHASSCFSNGIVVLLRMC